MIALLNILPRSVFNTLVALSMVLLLIVMQQLRREPPLSQARLMVREVSIAQLAPPPPPPQSQIQASVDTTPQLVLPQQTSDTSFHVSPIEAELPSLIEPNLDLAQQTELTMGFALAPSYTLDEIAIFGLDQLDQPPRLLNRINARIPADIASQGIDELKLMLHVIIHETGKVELVGTPELQYPQLASVADKIAQQAYFTSPMRYGKKVKAEFYWPVRIKA